MEGVSQSGLLSPYDLREEILGFVRSLRQPVLAEEGGQVFSLIGEPGAFDPPQDPSRHASVFCEGTLPASALDIDPAIGETGWRLEVEFGKLLLEFWGGGRSAVRRIERAERNGARLLLWARKPGWREGQVALEIRAAGEPASLIPQDGAVGGDGISPARVARRDAADLAAQRALDRGGFERELVGMLAREFPGQRFERVTHRSDRERSFSGCYTRGWALRGPEAWAFLGLSDLEGPAAAENALAYGLIWLDALQERCAARKAGSLNARVAGLKLVLPPAAVAVAAHRAAYLDPATTGIEILEWTRGQDHPHPIDLRDYGNVETRLTPRWRGTRLLEELRPMLREVLGLRTGEVNVVPDAAGAALSLRVFGLEVARIEGRTLPKIRFGLEGERETLDDASCARFHAFLEDVLRIRRARSPDRSHRFYRLQPERWLESLLVQDIGRIDPTFVPEHVYPQVPAFSGPATPELSRGVIDILGVTRDPDTGLHRLAVLELKLDEDPNLPLQGLDYWLRVKWLEDRDQFRECGYFPGLAPSPAPPVLYLVCPAFRFHSTTERVLRYFHPSIRVVKVGVNQRWREGIKALFRRTLQQGRPAEEEGIGSR